MDVVGLTLHPEVDGRFTILGVVDIDGKLRRARSES